MNKVFVYQQNTYVVYISYLQIGETKYVTFCKNR